MQTIQNIKYILRMLVHVCVCVWVLNGGTVRSYVMERDQNLIHNKWWVRSA